MGSSLVDVHVLDGTTGQPVPNPSLFINGQKTDVPTSLPSGVSYIFEAQAAGYQNGSISAVIEAGANTVTLSLSPVVSTVFIQLQFYPAQAGIAWNLTGPNGANYSGTSGDGGISTATVAPAAYDLTATAAGYEPGTQTIDASLRQSFIVTLIRSASSSSAVSSTQAVYNPINDPSNAFLTEDVSEEIYDNTAYQGFFTSAQANLYIGDLFIDQLNVIQYALQQNNVPVYAYCSEFYDAIGRGRSIVQGQIVLNYVHSGYLLAALNNYQNARKQTVSSNGKQLALLTKAAADPQTAAAGVQSQIANRLSSLLVGASPDDIDQAQQYLKSAAPADPYSYNPLYRHIVFDMRLEIGTGAYKTVRMFEGCKLGANEQIFDQSGQPVAESYTFMGRRLR